MRTSSRTAMPSAQARSQHARRSFWSLMHQVAAVAGATHIVFAGLFFELGAAFLAWVNVGSVLMFALSYLCLRRR